jgi:hypothetical protein
MEEEMDIHDLQLIHINVVEEEAPISELEVVV